MIINIRLETSDGYLGENVKEDIASAVEIAVNHTVALKYPHLLSLVEVEKTNAAWITLFGLNQADRALSESKQNTAQGD